MAVINFGSKTVNGAQDIADMTAALQAHYSTSSVPTPTFAQIQAYIQAETWARIVNIAKEWRRAQVVVSDITGT